MGNSSYRIYLLDERGRVDHVEVVSAPGDERAIEFAFSLIGVGLRHRGVEVWTGRRCIFSRDVFTASGPAHTPS